jgi:high-affinity nickel-transport protein
MEDRPTSSHQYEGVDMSIYKSWKNKASAYHSRVPYLNRLPFNAIAIIVTLVVVNILVWVAVGIVLVCLSLPLST